MADRRVTYGLLVGILGALVVLAVGGYVPWSRLSLAGRTHGPLQSDSQGALQTVVIHYVPEAAPMVITAYREFLAALPAEVAVLAVVPDDQAFRDLCGRLGDSPCRVRPVVVGHAMTTWSRDRWLALAPVTPASPATIFSPRREDSQLAWPERAGDQRVGDDLAHALPVMARPLRSRLEFDGGDFVTDNDTVFVTPRMVARNVPGRLSQAELTHELEDLFERKVVLLEHAPEHHAGMFMALVGDHVALVGDPSLGQALAPATRPTEVGFDFSEATQAAFDAVAAEVEKNGYDVVRMPILPGSDGRTYETPLNVIMDERADERVVYMPVYAHTPALNRRATEIWTALGFTVRPIDCSQTFAHFGSLRCLVNVLRRSPA